MFSQHPALNIADEHATSSSNLWEEMWPDLTLAVRVWHGALPMLQDLLLPSYRDFWPAKTLWPNSNLVLIWDAESPRDRQAARQLHAQFDESFWARDREFYSAFDNVSSSMPSVTSLHNMPQDYVAWHDVWEPYPPLHWDPLAERLWPTVCDTKKPEPGRLGYFRQAWSAFVTDRTLLTLNGGTRSSLRDELRKHAHMWWEVVHDGRRGLHDGRGRRATTSSEGVEQVALSEGSGSSSASCTEPEDDDERIFLSEGGEESSSSSRTSSTAQSPFPSVRKLREHYATYDQQYSQSSADFASPRLEDLVHEETSIVVNRSAGGPTTSEVPAGTRETTPRFFRHLFGPPTRRYHPQHDSWYIGYVDADMYFSGPIHPLDLFDLPDKGRLGHDRFLPEGRDQHRIFYPKVQLANLACEKETSLDYLLPDEVPIGCAMNSGSPPWIVRFEDFETIRRHVTEAIFAKIHRFYVLRRFCNIFGTHVLVIPGVGMEELVDHLMKGGGAM